MRSSSFLILFFSLYICCIGQSTDAIVRGWEKAALEGNESAQLHLGNCYYKGTLGCNKNLEKAKHYYQLAANQGNEEAQYKLAVLLKEIGLDTKEEIITFFNTLKSSADKGYSYAQFLLGMELYNIDQPEAFKYLKLAVDNGMYNAIYLLGLCYMQGLGCNIDYTSAISCFTQGEKCVKESYYVMDMSRCYLYTKDYKKAKEFLLRGTQLGEPSAYQLLSLMFARGDGVEKDQGEALRLIDLAIAKEPSNPKMHATKGRIFALFNMRSEAYEIWKELQQKYTDYANSSNDPFCKLMRKEKEGNVDIDIFQTSEINDNTYVVIIANENYRREPHVPYALNDGNIFKLYCQKTLGIPEENIKYLPDATYNDIRFGINWLNKISQIDHGNAKIILYYAGHGVPNEDLSTSYLLPTDGYVLDVNTGFDLNELYRMLGKINAKQIIIFLDACFSGTKRDGTALTNSRGVAIKAKQNEPLHNMVVLSAAQNDETAFDFKEQNHGMFTYYILKKLQESEGDISLNDLFSYVNAQVYKQSIRTFGKSQTPSIISGTNIDWKSIKLK